MLPTQGAPNGTVAELVDAPDLKSVEHYACEGSSPSRPIDTIQCQNLIKTFLIMQNFNIDSTAISNLAIDGDLVNLQYTSGDKEYSYQAQDPSTFVADLESCMANDASVGSFIAQCRKQGRLTDVTV